MSDDLTQRLAQMAREELREIAEDFDEAIGRKPAPQELGELLTYGIQSSREDLLEDVRPSAVAALRPKLSGGDQEHDSAVGELDDGPFSQANALVTDIARAYRGETGSLPKLQTLAAIILEALRGAGTDVFSGATGDDVVAIEPELREITGGAASPGDIVAIPAPGGRYFTAVVVTRNQSGTAYGLFDGTRGAVPVSSSSPPQVVRHPIYSGDEMVQNGTWPVVGHDDALLEFFPDEPEVFYDAPLMADVEPDIGPHGSAETPSGERRDLTEDEAEEVGLTDGSYSEFHPPETVSEYLASRQRANP